MRAIARPCFTTLLIPLVAPSITNVTAAPDQRAQTARMRIYSSAFFDAETGDLRGDELALEQHRDSAVDGLLYVYEGVDNDERSNLSGSIQGKTLTLKGTWVTHLIESPSEKEVIVTHAIRIDGTIDSWWLRVA